MIQPLTKSDLSWVIVKTIGIILLFTALYQLYASIVVEVIMEGLVKDLPQKHKPATPSTSSLGILLAVPNLLVSLYILRSGAFLHDCLMAIPFGFSSASCQTFEDDGGKLLGEEFGAFKVWVELNPEVSKRPIIDQIALFRDAQTTK